MPITRSSQSTSAHVEVREASAGHAFVRIRGRLDLLTTAACWRELEQYLSKMKPRLVVVDASEVQLTGGIGAALLRYLGEGGFTPGARVEMRGLSTADENILNAFAAEDFRAYRPRGRKKHSLTVEVGRYVRGLVGDAREKPT